MIKYNKSSMHLQNNLAFFKGRSFSNASKYLYEESICLFAEENLAANLIEYDEPIGFKFDIKNNNEIHLILQKIQIPSDRLLSIIDINVTNQPLNFDLELSYDPKMLSTLRGQMLVDGLVHFGFKVSISPLTGDEEMNVKGIDPGKMSYLRVNFSSSFLDQRSKSLSDSLKKSFDSTRYVDSNIPIFSIMTTLSGSSKV